MSRETSVVELDFLLIEIPIRCMDSFDKSFMSGIDCGFEQISTRGITMNDSVARQTVHVPLVVVVVVDDNLCAVICVVFASR